MRGKGNGAPMSGRDALTPEQLAALADQIVKLVVSLCNPADSIMVSVAAVKIIGELAKYECGQEAAAKLLVEATELARKIRVKIEPGGAADDPFVIEPADPFSLPEDK